MPQDAPRSRVDAAIARLRDPTRQEARDTIRCLLAQVRQSLDETDQLIAVRRARLDGYAAGFRDGQRSRRWGFRVYRGRR